MGKEKEKELNRAMGGEEGGQVERESFYRNDERRTSSVSAGVSPFRSSAGGGGCNEKH